SIPLRIQFSQANNQRLSSESVILTVETAQGIRGYGEACPRAYVTGEDMASVLGEVALLQRMLTGRVIEEISEIETLLCEELVGYIGNATCCALELALLDALGKEKGISIYEALANFPQQVVTYAGVLPMAVSNQQERLLGMIYHLGFREIKIKAGIEVAETLGQIEVLRTWLGPKVPLRLDVNEAWSLPVAMDSIPRLIESGIEVFEQIFPKGREADMEPVMASFGQDAIFMADESVTTLESAREALDNKWFNRLNLKLSKNGGLFRSRQIYQMAEAADVSSQLGAHVGETSILTAAGLIFSGMVPMLTAIEGGLGTLLLERDVVRDSLQFGPGARIKRPAQRLAEPGLGLKIELGEETIQ
ncbi:MAG: hypothetical protein NWR72_13510, partial [Bacteroidia bacterium]|nr:hypothetical protein [Bacteroidia bacterium]